MTDQELAARWDADHRLAATTSFISGGVAVLGTAALFTFGMTPIEAIVTGGSAGPFELNLVASLFLAVDLALLVFVVGLAYAFTEGRAFGVPVATAVATLATTVSATVHLVWAHVAIPMEESLPATTVQFMTWLAANLWLMPLYGLLVGATMLALSLALRASAFRFARRLGLASAVVGAVLLLITPFSGFGPGGSALVAVAAILVATAGISALLAIALVKLGLLLWRKGKAEPTI